MAQSYLRLTRKKQSETSHRKKNEKVARETIIPSPLAANFGHSGCGIIHCRCRVVGQHFELAVKHVISRLNTVITYLLTLTTPGLV